MARKRNRKRKTRTTVQARSAAHQAAVQARRTSHAAGAHDHPVPRGTNKRSAIADQQR